MRRGGSSLLDRRETSPPPEFQEIKKDFRQSLTRFKESPVSETLQVPMSEATGARLLLPRRTIKAGFTRK